MIPFKDDNPIRIFPFITIAIIVLNSIVLLMQMSSPYSEQQIAFSFGAIPRLLLSFNTYQPIHPFLTIFTSMFMHGGFLHLGGNMLYLWIFGNNIEDRLGHFRFIIFYLLCGVIAAYSHALAEPSSQTPMIGASGAVAGILGAYLFLFPHAKIHTLVFFGFFVNVIRLPALLVIGFWIIIQFVNGILSKGFAGQGGVAWFAHVGGFITGFLLIKLFSYTKGNSYD
jgi:membrane associated rhomboid family serine protease